MILDDLNAFAIPVLDAIGASGHHRYFQQITERLFISARHLSTAYLGSGLEAAYVTDPQPFAELLSTDQTTVTMAAQTLVFGGSASTLDLCASALGYWVGQEPPPGREFDMDDLTDNRDVRDALPDWADQWRLVTRGDNWWRTLDEYRHGQLHRIVRRYTLFEHDRGRSTMDVGLGLGDKPGYHTRETVGDEAQFSREREQALWSDLADNVTGFTRARWEVFWSALAADATAMARPEDDADEG